VIDVTRELTPVFWAMAALVVASAAAIMLGRRLGWGSRREPADPRLSGVPRRRDQPRGLRGRAARSLRARRHAPSTGRSGSNSRRRCPSWSPPLVAGGWPRPSGHPSGSERRRRSSRGRHSRRRRS